MKKLLLMIVTPFIFLSVVSAQITQAQADSIIMERMSSETQAHTIFAKDGVQTEMTITTANDEVFDLDYPCLVYYIRYEDETNHKFLIVNANNGNLLEIRTQGNAEPEDLVEWKFLPPKEVFFTEYSLEGTSCQWIRRSRWDYPEYFDEVEVYRNGVIWSTTYARVIAVNSNEELKHYKCIQNLWRDCVSPCIDYPEIDFSKHTLLLAYGEAGHLIIPRLNYTSLIQLSAQDYTMRVGFTSFTAALGTLWHIPIVIDKIDDDVVINLVITYY